MAVVEAIKSEPTDMGMLFAAWVIALGATLGALFIGEVMGQTPCQWCWYQRSFMFPLAVVLGVACYRSDAGVWRYALPLTGIGCLLSAYHNLVYFKIMDEALVPCSQSGPSCSSANMTILGGLPIPLLSLSAFAVIAALVVGLARRTS